MAGQSLAARGSELLARSGSALCSVEEQLYRLITRGATDRGRRRVLRFLLVYGVLVALAAGAFINLIFPEVPLIMDSRSQDIYNSVRVLNAGGPPLLGRIEVPSPSGPQLKYVPVGVTDDQGIYVLYPLLMHWFGTDDLALVLRWTFIVLMGLVIFMYPMLSYLLFDSLAIALLSPAPFALRFSRAIPPLDIYWFSAWVLLLCQPIIFLQTRRWGKFSTSILAVLMIVASAATSLRVHSGLPVLLAVLLLLGMVPLSWRQRLATGVMLSILYLTVQPIGLSLLRRYRNSTIGMATLGSGTPNQHPFWHSVYAGLGYLDNGYGLKWDDTTVAEAVRRVDPNAQYLSKEYSAALRQLVLALVREHPGFVLKTLVVKFSILSWTNLKQSGLGLALLFWLMWSGSQRRQLRQWVVLMLPALLIGLLPPLLTIPSRSYSLGWYAAVSTLWMLGMAGFLWECRSRGAVDPTMAAPASAQSSS